ncbi:response regulator transcription factor [Helicovermis profundi]|uniref:Stage 0 sporulation protein A homolog n=1 Tax=Helicovermis profundi TaxID=3065157 RepID=A0AAU9ECG0_9FIRM|nr:response regulator transcription factor [Clostridia bacterium S502]
MIRVLIVDDQEIISRGLSMILSLENDIEVVGLAKNGSESIKLVKKHLPDIVLMDIRMPLLSGIEAIKIIKRDFKSVKIIILTTFSDDEYIYDGIKNGASGYLLKDTEPSEISKAIRIVYNGGATFEPNVALKLASEFSKVSSEIKDTTVLSDKIKNKDNLEEVFTSRELDIVKLITEGKNNSEIAKDLFISEGTVKNNITRILNKLELRDRTQLAIYALKRNLV